MESYVVGFMFTEKEEQVVLIEKMKPLWQKGNLNGVGGRVECGESSLDAMVREFFEETGVNTCNHDWTKFAIIKSVDGCYIEFFFAKSDKALTARTMEDEVVHICNVNSLPPNTIKNVRWLLFLALDSFVNLPIAVEEKNREVSNLR